MSLVGRQAELDRIWQLFEKSGVADERVGGLVLCGPAGIGKTSLLRAVMTAAPSHGCHLVWTQGTKATSDLPFGAMVDVLPALTGHAGAGTEMGSRPQPGTLFVEAAAQLVALAGRRRLAVALDDVTLADEATITLLHLLVTHHRAFVLTTIRDGESLPAPLEPLWRSGALAWVAVRPLDLEAVDSVAVHTLDGPVHGKTVVELARISGGNPLFLRELLRAAVDQGALRRDAGGWRLITRPELPTPLADLFWQRIAHLPPDVLDVVHLVGHDEPVEADLVLAVVDRRAVERAERDGLVRVTACGRRSVLRIAHPLYGEVLCQRRGDLHVRPLRGAIAGALAATGLRRGLDALRLALYHLDGVVRPDRAVLLRAVREAAAAFDHRLVIRLGGAARQAGAGFPASLAVAEGYAWSGDVERAETLFEELERQASTDNERGMAARSRAVNLFFGLGRTRAARAVIADALDRLDDPSWRAELRSLEAGIAITLTRSAEAFELAVAGLDEFDSERLRLHRLPGTIGILAGLGHTAAAIETGVDALAAVESAASEYPYLGAITKASLVEARLLHGELRPALSLAGAEYRSASELGVDGARGLWALALARAELLRGCLGPARERFQEAAGLLHRNLTLLGRSGIREAHAGLAIVLALQGDHDAAADSAQAADSIVVEDCGAPTSVLAGAWLAGLQGDRSTAPRVALEAAATHAELGNHGYEPAALYVVVLFGSAALVAERLRELAERYPGPMREAYADHARGLVDDDPALLQRTAAAFASIGALPFAAAAAVDAAAGYARSGNMDTAVLAVEHARLYRARCPGYPLLRDVDTSAIPELTAREREIARLATAGLSNVEIASRIVVSVRTVETHLSNAYSKLGRSGRAGLVAVFEPARVDPAGCRECL